jgi:hypothetical protein
MATANIRPSACRRLNLDSGTGLSNLIPASQEISRCVRLPDLFNVVLESALVCSCAEIGAILTLEEDGPWVHSQAKRELDEKVYFQISPRTKLSDLEQYYIPESAIQYILASEKAVSITVTKPSGSRPDPDSLSASLPKQALIHSIIPPATETTVLLYLQRKNNNPFSKEAISSVSLLCEQAAISHETVNNFSQLGDAVAEQMKKISRLKKSVEQTDLTRTGYLTTINDAIQSRLSTILSISKRVQFDKSNNASLPGSDYFLDQIQQSARDLAELFENAFAFSTTQPNRQPAFTDSLDPALLAQTVYQSNRRTAAEKGIDFNLNFTGSPPESILTDRAILNRILMSALYESIQLSQKNDTINFSVTTTSRVIRFAISHKQTHPKNEIGEARKRKSSTDDITATAANINKFSPFFDLIDINTIEKAVTQLGGKTTRATKNKRPTLSIEISNNNSSVSHSVLPGSSKSISQTLGEIPADVMSKMNLELTGLLSIPIYKGGTIQRIIRRLLKQCEGYESDYPDILNKITTTVYDGNDRKFKRLIHKALASQ